MTNGLIRERYSEIPHHTERRGDGDVKIEAEIEVVQPQAKECCHSLETRRSKKWILFENLQKEKTP